MAMKKNKLIINKQKIKKLTSIIALAGMLNNPFATALQANSDVASLEKSISLGYETLNYNEATYNEQSSMNTLKAILASNLSNVIDNNLTNEEIQKEINQHLASMSVNTLNLARMYKSLEDDTIKKSGLTSEEIYKASNKLTIKVDAQHYLHTILDRLNLVRKSSDKDSLKTIFNLYKNEYLEFSVDSTADMRKETNFLLSAFKSDIYTFIVLVLDNNTGRASTLANEILSYLKELEYLVTQSEYNPSNCNYIFTLIEKIANLLPAEIFGDKAMRKGLIIEFATQHSMNTILTNLEMYGYDILKLTNYKTENKTLNNETITLLK